MADGSILVERRTSADVVFNELYDKIVDLDLKPGAKISEVEIAKRFGISRQPVRDAFNRLSNLGLLVVRPQRATVVRYFSLEAIAQARFLRTAVEVEVMRRACTRWDDAYDAPVDASLAAQQEASEAGDTERFHTLDYEFHKLLCEGAGAGFAFETIAANKAQVDRLCVLSLSTRETMSALVADHVALVTALRAGDAAEAERVTRRHLERLDATIEAVHATHRAYFAD